ncbi:MAG: tetratricopeptide (TPR) repeat protein [Pseudohongiellaceae bacterium]|jgi:tetratricopeptide (TPR) repeat protein
MSLVNDMLRDLDKRKRGLHNSGQSRAVFDHADGAKKFPGKALAALIVAGVVLGVAGGLYLTGGSLPEQIQRSSAVSGGNPIESVPVETVSEILIETAVPITARIAGSRETDSGFEVRIEVSQEVSFEILSQTERRLQVLVRDVQQLGNTASVINTMTILQASDGVLLTIELDHMAEFLIYENLIGQLFALTIEGFWQDFSRGSSTSLTEQGGGSNTDSELRQEGVQFENTLNNSDVSTDIADNNFNPESLPQRTARVLSLQDRDRNVSQKALRLAQDGQVIQANNDLLGFISDNPEAHQARNTLATLLFAQQDYLEAEAIIDEGLVLAPNYSAYKKIKARILIMAGGLQDAIVLLKSSPPPVAEDVEYFELLASIYQQNNQHNAAIETYQDLLREDSAVGRWWTGMAISLESLGNGRDALNSYEAGLQVDNLDARLRQYSQARVRILSAQ